MMFRPNKLAMSLAVFAVSSVAAFAQTKTVSGTIVDDFGEPIAGANVVIVGTTTGVTTDADGNFTLKDVPTNAKLKISFLGYAEQVLPAVQTKLNVTMKEDFSELDEVVMIGYGTSKRRDLTGSVASISGDKLVANPVPTVADALQGALPGVNVISQDGRPGGETTIRVRGGGSITQTNDPLFVVDGVQVSSIDDIAGDNIESIDVLKDAASTAIYGARGANGVIIITTKSGKEGKAVVKYNGYYQIKQKPETLDVMDAYDNVLWNWGYAKALGDSYANGVAKYYGLGSAYGNHLNDYKSQSAHNYMDDVLQNTQAWNHDVSLSGGNAQTKYFADVNYTDNEGALINSGFHRLTANAKLSHSINRKLKWDVDVRYSEMQFSGNRYEIATQSYRYRPIDNPLGTGDPTDLGMGGPSAEDIYNPVSIVNDYENLRQRYRVGVNTGLTWVIVSGLTAKTEGYLSRNWSKSQAWVGGHTNGESYNSATLTEGDGYDTRWFSNLNYDVKGLGEDHSLSFMGGFEMLASHSNSTKIYGTTYPEEWDMNWAFGNINMTNKTNDTYSYTDGRPVHTFSWLGRLNYSFLKRYLFSYVFRYDGTSNFLGDNRWVACPGGALAWRISDEPFWSDDVKDWMDNLKLRLSLGTAGNDRIKAGLTKTQWVTGTAIVNGESISTYKTADILGNADLKWEVTISRNIGLDYSFWNGGLRGSIDFYKNTTKDVLMLVPCDPTTGFGYQMQNIAETSNSGVEVSLNYEIVRKKDWSLSFGMVYNFNKNNVEKLQEGVLAGAHTNWGSTMRKPNFDYIVKEGEPVGLIQGFKSAGFYSVDDFDVVGGVWTLKDGVPDNQLDLGGDYGANYNRPSGQHAYPGMVKFENVNGDKVVNDDDATVIGHAMPKHTGGFNFSGRWKSIDFSANFTYQLGGDVYNANLMSDMMGNKDTGLGYSRLAEVAKTWKMCNIDTNGDIYVETDPDKLRALNKGTKYGFTPEYGVCQSEFVEDATYLRLQTLTVGYTVPKSLTKKVGVSNARVYFTGGNLFCLKKYSGLDPDVNVSRAADSSYSGFPTLAYDYRAYPKSRTFTFGVNVAF